MTVSEILNQLAVEYGFELSDKELSKFQTYNDLLIEWNEKINLTAITEPRDVAIKHFLDSLMLSKFSGELSNKSLIDVGTGAGFPSIPLGIANQGLKLTLLDSLNKRVKFLDLLVEQLGINATTLHSRAEDGGRNPKLREKFDFATARAVAHLRELAEYCLPFVKKDGLFIALKGFEVEQEVDEARNAIKLLGGEIVNIEKITLPDENKRSFIIIKKISQTSTIYPRLSAKIAKSPLK